MFLRKTLVLFRARRLRDKRLGIFAYNRIFLITDCKLQRALWTHSKSWRGMGDRKRSKCVQSWRTDGRWREVRRPCSTKKG